MDIKTPIWIPFFNELLKKICSDYDAAKLYKVWNDYFPNQYIDINKMDPFTFIARCLTVGQKEDTKFQCCKKLKEDFNLKSEAPSQYKEPMGMPSLKGAMIFFCKDYRNLIYEKHKPESEAFKQALEPLWDLAQQVVNGNIQEETFNKCASIKWTGDSLLTQVIFICNPYKFYSLDNINKKYLEMNGESCKSERNYHSFQEFQKKASKINPIPYEFSINAFQAGDTPNKNGDKTMNKQPLNQILYGPPGTGKTYNTKNIISKIFKMKENFYNWFIDKSNANDKEKTFKDYLSSIIKINENFGINIFEIYDKKRFVNIKNLIKETDYYKNNYKHSETSQGTSYYDSALNQYENFLNDTNYVKRVEFITFHQSYSYEEFVEGIRPVILRGDDWGKETDVKYKGEDGIFKQICNRARDDKENNYVLIIDEINRGNISKIFGELITLIEEDKRENVTGEDKEYNTIKVRLPYSQNEFSVPNNLYIIGTMNTADKSLALLDVALRRRFEFVPMYPQYKDEIHYENENYSDILKELNNQILIKKGNNADYLIGHSYFLGKEPIADIFNKKVIPLLMEYFNGKTKEVYDLLNNNFKIEFDDKYMSPDNAKTGCKYYYLQVKKESEITIKNNEE